MCITIAIINAVIVTNIIIIIIIVIIIMTIVVIIVVTFAETCIVLAGELRQHGSGHSPSTFSFALIGFPSFR